MRKSKLFTIIIITLLMSVFALIFTGCDDNKDLPPTYSISIKNETVSLVLDSSYTLPVELEGIDKSSLTWSSSDDSIVSVAEGVVVGRGIGTATVTATFGEKKDSCEVTVGLGEFVPSLENNIGNNARITIGSNFDIVFNVDFNQNKYNDLSLVINGENLNEYFDYTTSENIITISPKKEGEISFSIVASWRGVENMHLPTMSSSLSLTIVEDLYFTINNNALMDMELYHVKSLAGQDFVNNVQCSFQVVKNGQLVDDAQVSVSIEDKTIAEYVDGNITGVKIGTTKVNLSYNDGVKTHTDYFYVIVNRPEVTIEELTTFSIANQSLCVNGEELDINRIEQLEINDKTIVLNDGVLPKISLQNYTTAPTLERAESDVLKMFIEGVDGSIDIIRKKNATEFNSVNIKVTMSDCVYNLTNSKIYSMLIDSKEDLALVLGDAGIASEKNSSVKNMGNYYLDAGYYVLTNNIDATGIVFSGNNKNIFRFYGIFDGRGYTITNANLASTNQDLTNGTLFGSLQAHATVKNLGIENCNASLSAAIANYGGCGQGLGGQGFPQPLVENIYVHPSLDTVNFFGVLRYSLIKMSNVVVNYKTTEKNEYFGSFADLSYGDAKEKNFTDCYVVSPTPLSWVGAEELTIDGVVRYENYSSLKDANLTYQSFDNKYWKVIKGVPEWINATPIEIPLVDSNQRAYDISTKTLELEGLPFTMQDVVAVKIGNAMVLIENGIMPDVVLQNVSTAEIGKIRTEEKLKITVNGADMYVTRSMTDKEFNGLPVELTLEDGSVYLLENVNIYTKIIKTPSDLQSAFGSDKVMNGNYDDGYYVLGNNIDATNVNFKNAIKVNGKYFRGILDGKGYTIFNADLSSTNPRIWGVTEGSKDGGLIGMSIDSSAAIRNLGLINIKANGMSILSDRICLNAGPGGGYPMPVIENMYVEVSSENENLVGLSIDAAGAYFQNVIVKYDKHEQINQNGTFFRPASAFYQEWGGGASNCYSISLTKASGNASEGAIVEWPYAGLTSYENVDAMKQAGNDYSAFNDCWLVEQGEIPVWKNNCIS